MAILTLSSVLLKNAATSVRATTINRKAANRQLTTNEMRRVPRPAKATSDTLRSSQWQTVCVMLLIVRESYFERPGDEIVPAMVNEPTPVPGPVNMAVPSSDPPPVVPAKRPVPPAAM